MNTLKDILKEKPLVYVTRDIERALGLSPEAEGYYIIANATGHAKGAYGDKPHILLIEEEHLLSTHALLEHSETKTFLKKNNISQAVVFKNTPRIERTCTSLGLTLLNPPAALAAEVEGKISQLEWLLFDYADVFPKPRVVVEKLKDAVPETYPCVVQFNTSHTGSGTHVVKTKDDLKNLQQKFPERPARIFPFITGPTYTLNCVVGKDAVIPGHISYQITGLEPFTSNPLATIGNDWALPQEELSLKQYDWIMSVTKEVGARLQNEGWRGLFGVDVIIDQVTQEVYLLEINARQPASTTTESQEQETWKGLETESRQELGWKEKEGAAHATVFELHLLALLEQPLVAHRVQRVTRPGAQIIFRQKNPCYDVSRVTDLHNTLLANGFSCTLYDNTESGQDLLRIQSTKGFMTKHGELNENAKALITYYKKYF